jgi:hypothetical protein
MTAPDASAAPKKALAERGPSIHDDGDAAPNSTRCGLLASVSYGIINNFKEMLEICIDRAIQIEQCSLVDYQR